MISPNGIFAPLVKLNLQPSDFHVKNFRKKRDTLTEMSTSALEVFLRRLDEFVPRGSQERIAGLAGLASETISRWKNRHTVPDLVSIEALAQAIDVPLVNLVTETASSEQMDACIDLLNESGRQLEIAGQRLRADAERMRRRAPRPQKAHEP